MTSAPNPDISSWIASTFARKAPSSTVRDSDCTITISADFSGPRSLSVRNALARSDSYLPASRRSVVVALPRNWKTRAPATAISTAQTPTVIHGLRALMRARCSVTG